MLNDSLYVIPEEIKVKPLKIGKMQVYNFVNDFKNHSQENAEY